MSASAAKTILIIDDDRLFAESIRRHFQSERAEVLIAGTGGEGLAIAAKRKVDLVLLDQVLPDGKGSLLCPPLLATNDQAVIIFITAQPSFANAVEAVRIGAFDYITKPFELAELELSIGRAFKTIELENIAQIQSYQSHKEHQQTSLVGSGLREVQGLVEKAARVDSHVLITGETGTGKNLVAKLVHFKAGIEERPFISVNCSAIPESLMEAELFGYEKGAFTGAVASKKGVFELAESGTLFLDEIGDMPLHLQAKLLGVLDDKCVKRIGSESVRPINVRILAATNSNLEEAVEEGKFRKDLFYRLNVLRINLPPLRERRGDIGELAAHILGAMPHGHGRAIDPSEVEKMQQYDWPGNVRELRNVIERALIISREEAVRPSQLLDFGGGAGGAEESGEEIVPYDEMERRHILRAFGLCGENYTQAAKALGLSLSTLRRKIAQYKGQPESPETQEE